MKCSFHYHPLILTANDLGYLPDIGVYTINIYMYTLRLLLRGYSVNKSIDISIIAFERIDFFYFEDMFQLD